MERKRFGTRVGCILLVAVFAIAFPSVAISGSAKLSADEEVLLSHLPDQQIGKTYPKGETINVGFLAALSGPDAGWDSLASPEILSGLMR